MNNKIYKTLIVGLTILSMLTGCSFGNKTSSIVDSSGNTLKVGDKIDELTAFDSTGYTIDRLISLEYNSTQFDVSSVLSSTKSEANKRGWFSPVFKLNYSVDVSKVEFDIFTTTAYRLTTGRIFVLTGITIDDSRKEYGDINRILCPADETTHITINLVTPVRIGKGKYMEIMSNVYDEEGNPFYNRQDTRYGHNWFNLKVEMVLA
ncbi:MAG: hypothetical protein ACI318_00935 [Bacilli bacterium]